MQFSLVLLVFSCILVHTIPGQYAKLPVTVYYESLCPDSVRFIADDLYPVYRDLKDFIDILFVPFGKSRSIDGGKLFECQHGPDECTGNKIQSCALNLLADDPDLQMKFVACQMRFDAEKSGEECVNAVGLDWTQVTQCYHCGLGTQLQLQAERLTNTVRPTFVPTIIFNHREIYQRDQRFIDVVCRLINNVAPICQQ